MRDVGRRRGAFVLPRSFFPSTVASENISGATKAMRCLEARKVSWDRFSRSAVNFQRKPKVIWKPVRIVRKGFFDQSLAADGDYKRGKDRKRNLECLRLIALLRPCRQPYFFSWSFSPSPRLSPSRFFFLFVQLLLSSSSSSFLLLSVSWRWPSLLFDPYSSIRIPSAPLTP